MDVVRYYGINVDNKGKALCPFHSDNNPSLSVSEKKQVAKCFSCKEGGNAITFVKKYEEQVNHNPISINEAIIKVVEICSLDIDVSRLKKNKENFQYITTTRKYNDEERDLIDTNKYLAKLFNYILTVPTELTKDNNLALNYLHERGISDEIIKEMNLGAIQKGLILKKDTSPEVINKLQKLGMIKYGDNGYYEVFEDRIMFPITDEKGNIITFAGRTIKDDTPKYLHTAETSLFHKRELLYNYSNAKNYSYNDELFIVEGYMDVIGAKKKGIDNVVALMGTAITEEHINLLKKNHCSITLALDNDYTKEDNTGKNAMINVIPELLKQGFKVDVLDISKLGQYKDFGNLGNTELSKQEIMDAKESSFTFMMDNYYFKHIDFNVEGVNEVYNIAFKDKFISSTLDESKFVEYILKRTSLSKEDIEQIIHPSIIEEKVTPLSSFQDTAMNNYIIQSIKEYVSNKNDKILSSFYKLNAEKINNVALEVFKTYNTRYLSQDNTKLNTEFLLDDVLKLNNDYAMYVALNSFSYNNVFDKTYIKNINGSAKVNLNYNQKEQIIKQFETSLKDEDKLALEEVEELYIINDTSDLDGILTENNNTMKMFKSNIKDRMFLNKGNMDFFKYGNLFLKVDKDFISDKYKGRTGNFKTILFFNNLTGILKIDKEQLTKDSQDAVIHDKEIDTQESIDKDYVFSINKILFVPELETESDYFIRVPNTEAKDYIYLPKVEGNWSSNEEILFTKLKSNQKYKIYDRQGNFKYEITANELKKHWEDKTNKKVFESKSEIKEEPKESSKVVPFTPIKEPVCKVFKSKILSETDNGYYLKTNDSNTILFASKKICKWNQSNDYLIIKPKRNRLTGSGISKYNYDGENKTFDKRLSLEEIKEYLSIFYPASFIKKNKEIIKVDKSKCEYLDNFIKIPITLDNVFGYVRVNVVKCREDGNHIIIELSKNEQLSFYSKEDTYIGNYNAVEIRNNLNDKAKIIPFPVQNSVDFNKLVNSYSDAIYECGEDKLEFKTTTIESGYEFFETVTTVSLNGNYLYKPESRNVAPYKNIVEQRGVFREKEEVVAFLKTYFGNRELSLCEKSMEREVAV